MIPIIDSGYLKGIIAIVLFFVITMVTYYFFGIVGIIAMLCIGVVALICVVICFVYNTRKMEQESKEE